MCLPNDDPNKLSRGLFEYLGTNPGRWVLSAERLKNAADSLRESCWPSEREWHDSEAALADFMIGPVYMMLMAFAIENLLKAMIIKREPNLVEKQKLAKSIRKHDLNEYSGRLGLRQCPQYHHLLKRLEMFAVSWGRYPVTAIKRDMDSMLHAHFNGDADFESVQSLWGFLRKKLRELLPDMPLED